MNLSPAWPTQVVTAKQVIAAMSGAIAQAKVKNVKVYLGTILPYKGSTFYTDVREAQRQSINGWIRSNKDIAGVTDFDRVMHDPADLLRMRAALHTGDGLHPNDAGYARMAAAVDVAVC